MKRNEGNRLNPRAGERVVTTCQVTSRSRPPSSHSPPKTVKFGGIKACKWQRVIQVNPSIVRCIHWHDNWCIAYCTESGNSMTQTALQLSTLRHSVECHKLWMGRPVTSFSNTVWPKVAYTPQPNKMGRKEQRGETRERGTLAGIAVTPVHTLTMRVSSFWSLSQNMCVHCAYMDIRRRDSAPKAI